MPATSVPAARDALLAALQANTDLVGALIRRGIPTDIPNERERIYFLRVENGDRTRLTEQRGQSETYDLRLIVEVKGYGKTEADWETVNDRMWAIVDTIDATIEDDPELGGAVNDSMMDGFDEGAPGLLPDGWVASVTVAVSCEAWI